MTCDRCGFDGPPEEEEAIFLDPGETRPICSRCGEPRLTPRRGTA